MAKKKSDGDSDDKLFDRVAIAFALLFGMAAGQVQAAATASPNLTDAHITNAISGQFNTLISLP
jgi:hypothetical protein